MKIIEANKFHTPVIIEMLKHYREKTPVDFFKHCDDEKHIEMLLTHIYMGSGFVLLAYQEETPIGMMICIIEQLIWDTDIRVLKELAYWVEPEHRGSSAGYRLITEYVNLGKEFIKSGRIKTMTISKMVNSPDLKYDRFGFTKQEETWSLA